MKEAILYDKTDSGKVKCKACAHRCVIADGKRGICGVRENNNGVLYSMVYGKLVATNVDPIEKKPLFHFLPGTTSYSIATVGCNLRCGNCQNWDISQSPREGRGIVGVDASPEDVVGAAVDTGCESVSYTYTEPTVYIEFALDTMKIARKEKLGNVFVSNGYMTPESVNEVSGLLDADNVDLKSFNDKFYRENCGAALEPVLDTLKLLKKNGVWIEVTTLLIPGMNDSPKELKQIAGFIKEELGEAVPWHVSRFHPHYKMDKTPSTPLESIRKARQIGIEAGLKYVYAGNMPHEESENTYCPKCGKLLIERLGFDVLNNRVGGEGRCPYCKTKIAGIWNLRKN